MEERVCFGIDVGGTTIKIGLFNDTLELLEKWEIPTPKKGQSADALPLVVYNIKKIMSEREITECMGIGICVPGPVLEDGTVRECVNLGWEEFNIKEKIKTMLGLEVWAGNDANAAAFGEVRLGRGIMNAVMITLGTGIGGGIIYKGEILIGSNGSAGEIGHINVAGQEGFVCGCGKNGCVETVASGKGIVRLGRKMLEYYKGETVLKKDDFSAKTIFENAQKGDELSIMIVRKSMKYLAKAMANISAVIDPEAFIIGGGVSNAGEFLINIIKEEYEKAAFKGNKGKEILIAKLGENAGLYGAAAKLLETSDGDSLDYALYRRNLKSE